MSPPERQFYQGAELNTILINKEDLLKIDVLIKTSFYAENIMAINILTDYDNTKIKAQSVDAFLLVNGLPDKLGRLEIQFIGKEQSIYIALMNYRMNLSVYGKDETWVLGTFHKLSSFFSDKKPWFHSRKIAASILLILIWLMAAITFTLYWEKYLFTAFLFTIMTLFSYYIRFTSNFDKYFPSFELRLSMKTNIINKEMIVIILAALTLIATIIGGIILPLWNK